jgi:hypothetical protein
MVAPFVFTDNARSTLGASIGLGSTTITLASGGGALLPNPAPGTQFTLTLNDQATQTLFETVWCTARAGDVLTVIRAQEGTAARAWGTGDFCWNGPTAGTQNNMVQIPHITDATLSPVFGPTQVQGPFQATGPATFSTTGVFGGQVTATDPSVGTTAGLIVQAAAPQTNGARIVLQGNPGSTGTPNKYIRSVNGNLDILNSAGTNLIFLLNDVGDLSSIRNLSANGTGSFAGAVTSQSSGNFVDPNGQGGVSIVAGPASGGIAAIGLHGTGPTPNKFLRATGGVFQIINSAYTQSIFGLDDAGNMTTTGGANIPGTVSAGAVNATGVVIGQAGVQTANGNIIAFGGRLRASLGAKGSGDPNAAVLLADYTLNPSTGAAGYQVFPNGLVIQWGYGALNGDPNVPEFFPIAFPNACLSVVCTEGAASGSWFVASPPTPTVHGVNGFVFNAWFHAGVVWSEIAGKVWVIANLTTSWIAVGY